MVVPSITNLVNNWYVKKKFISYIFTNYVTQASRIIIRTDPSLLSNKALEVIISSVYIMQQFFVLCTTYKQSVCFWRFTMWCTHDHIILLLCMCYFLCFMGCICTVFILWCILNVSFLRKIFAMIFYTWHYEPVRAPQGRPWVMPR